MSFNANTHTHSDTNEIAWESTHVYTIILLL